MKQKKSENYLEKIPQKNPKFRYVKEKSELITIEIDNKGFFNRALQLLIKKPRVSYMHLDEFGSFVVEAIDGTKNLIQIGELVKEHFGDKAEPLYERLSQFIGILSSHGFCIFK